MSGLASVGGRLVSGGAGPAGAEAAEERAAALAADVSEALHVAAQDPSLALYRVQVRVFGRKVWMSQEMHKSSWLHVDSR